MACIIKNFDERIARIKNVNIESFLESYKIQGNVKLLDKYSLIGLSEQLISAYHDIFGLIPLDPGFIQWYYELKKQEVIDLSKSNKSIILDIYNYFGKNHILPDEFINFNERDIHLMLDADRHKTKYQRSSLAMDKFNSSIKDIAELITQPLDIMVKNIDYIIDFGVKHQTSIRGLPEEDLYREVLFCDDEVYSLSEKVNQLLLRKEILLTRLLKKPDQIDVVKKGIQRVDDECSNISKNLDEARSNAIRKLSIIKALENVLFFKPGE